MLVKGTTILKSPVKLILCESVLQKKQRHIARKQRKDEVDVNLNSGSDEMSSESWIKVDCGDALLQDQDLPTSLASNDPDAPKAKAHQGQNVQQGPLRLGNIELQGGVQGRIKWK